MLTPQTLANVLLSVTKKDLEDAYECLSQMDKIFEGKELPPSITLKQIEDFDDLVQSYSNEVFVSVMYKKLSEEKV